MLYNTPVRGEDGLYFVKALNDDKRKCLVQLNDVKVVETSGEVVFDVDSEENIRKIQEIDTLNLGAAEDNSMSWFGKELSGGSSRRPTPSVSPKVRFPQTASMKPRFSTPIRNQWISRSKLGEPVMSFSNSLESGLPKRLLGLLGISSKSGSTMNQSSILTQKDMPLSSEKKIVEHI
jgi:hypothetical protein